MEINEEAREKTAFATEDGLFKWIRMPFIGFTGAPSTFQRMMQLVLRGCTPQFCLVHLDDILIFSKDMESHGKDLDVVLGKIRHAGLKISANKCQIGKDELVYLGHKLTPEGLKIDEGKITKCLTFPNRMIWSLQHHEDGKGKPICCFSRLFDKHERNYGITEKECLAVIYGISICRP